MMNAIGRLLVWAGTLACFTAWPLTARGALDVDTFGPEYNVDYSGGWGTGIEQYGRLHTPTGYALATNPSKTYPLIVFFHGIGERYDKEVDAGGPGNTWQVVSANNITDLFNHTKDAAFLYAPQAGGSGWSDETLMNVMAGVAKIMNEYKIARDQVYVTGLSLGGGACWTAMMKYPVFAAGIPICGVAPNAGSDPAVLAGMPVWAFHNIGDPTVGVGNTRTRINEIREAQGLSKVSFPVATTGVYTDGSKWFQDPDHPELQYSECGGTTHGVWYRAYSDNESGHAGMLYNWMWAKRKTVAPLQKGEKILFDFGISTLALDGSSRQLPDSQGRVWNCGGSPTTTWSYSPEKTLGYPLKPALTRTSAGRQTLVGLMVTGTFGGNSAIGGTSGVLYDAEISKDSFITASGGTAALKIYGLSSGSAYRLSIYATGTDSDGNYGRVTRYQVESAYADLDAYNNVSMRAAVSGTADADGTLTLKVMPKPGSTTRYGMISAMEIALDSPNQPPVAVADAVTMESGTSADIAVLANDYDPDQWPQTLTLAGVGAPGHGTAAIVSGTLLHYVPSTYYTGADMVTYTLSDGTAQVTGTVSITVVRNSQIRPLRFWRLQQGLPADGNLDLESPAGDGIPNLIKYALNLAPLPGDLARPGQVMVTGGTAGLPLLEASGSNGVAFSYVRRKAESLPGIAYVAEQSDDLLSWSACAATPSVASVDTLWERVTYTVNRNEAGSRFLRLKIATTNEAPTAVDDSVQVFMDSEGDLDVLANDSDPDGWPQALSIVSAGAPAHGAVSVASGKLHYIPAAGYYGADALSYTITDGEAQASALVNITVAKNSIADNLTAHGMGGFNLGTATGGSRELLNYQWEVTGAGDGPGGTADSMHCELESVCGDFVMTARVEELAAASRIGLAAREGLAAGDRMMTVSLAADQSALASYRLNSGGAAMESTLSGSADWLAPGTWLMIQRQGNRLTAALSHDNVTYVTVAEQDFANLAATLQIGLWAKGGTTSQTGRGVVSSFGVSQSTAVFSQNFDRWDAASVLANYIAASPGTGQMNDISAEADGGAWTVSITGTAPYNGRLILTRPVASSGSNNGAGFTRLTTGSTVQKLAVTFNVSLTGINTYGDLATLDLGAFTAFADYNSTSSSIATANRLLLKGAGNGVFALRLNGTNSASFPANGTEVKVQWYLNHTSGTISYQGPDLSEQTLAAGKCDLWANGVKVFDDYDRSAYSLTGSNLNGFRFRTSTDQAMTLTIDDLNMTPLP